MGERTARAYELERAGRTKAEIAAEMGIAVSSVHALLHKARKHLRGEVKVPGHPTSARLAKFPDVHPALNDVETDYSHMGEPHCPRCGLRGSHLCVEAPSLYGRRSPLVDIEEQS